MAAAPPQAQGQVPATPQNSRWLAEREYERPFIHRQSAAKIAVEMLAYVDEADRNMSTLLVLSERLVSYFDRGMPSAETLDDLMQRAMPRGMDEAASGQGYANTPPPPGDDDIPF
jgi:hypothetical protein